jgi:methionine-rich copper-binding protein CopC
MVFEIFTSDGGWSYLALGEGGISEIPGTGDVPLFTAFAPLPRYRFGLAEGSTVELVASERDVDVTGDGRPERVTLRRTSTLLGFESLTTPAGSFSGAAHLRTTDLFGIALSDGSVVEIESNIDEWLAPGVGAVRVDTVILDRSRGAVASQWSMQLAAFEVGAKRSDAVAPRITASSPAAGSSSRNAPQGIELRFSEPIDTISALRLGSSPSLHSEAGVTVPLVLRALSADYTTLYLEFDQQRLQAGSYAVRFAGLADFAGNPLDGSLPAFVYDDRGPAFVQSLPADGSTEAALEGDLVLTFSEPLFSDAPSDLWIAVRHSGSTVQRLPATIVGNTLRATLARPLQINSAHSLFVEGNLQDALGNGVDLWNTALASFTTMSGPLAPGVTYSAGLLVRSHAVLDVDGNGRLDVVQVILEGADHRLVIRDVLDDGTVGGPRGSLSLGSSCGDTMATGDFDADGRTDLAACGSVLMQRAPLDFVAEKPSFLGQSLPTATDLGRDGRSDLVLYAPVPGGPPGAFAWTTWSRGADGSWQQGAAFAPAGTVPARWSIHDMNQDGLPDLVWSQLNGSTGVGEVWWASGFAGAGFGSPRRIDDVLLAAGDTAYSVVDLDGDGIRDLVVRGPATPDGFTMSWHRGLGANRFASGGRFQVLRSPADGIVEASVPFDAALGARSWLPT